MATRGYQTISPHEEPPPVVFQERSNPLFRMGTIIYMNALPLAYAIAGFVMAGKDWQALNEHCTKPQEVSIIALPTVYVASIFVALYYVYRQVKVGHSYSDSSARSALCRSKFARRSSAGKFSSVPQ
jgi:hypothetical protein